MLGILDWTYAFLRVREKPKKTQFEFEVLSHTLDKEVSFYFVPRIVSQSSFANGIISPKGISVIYTLHSCELIDSNPQQTVKNLGKPYEHFKDVSKQFLSEEYRINLVGVSLGNVLAIKAGAEIVNGRLNRIDSIAGGLELGESAFRGILTRDKAGQVCSSALAYEEGVSEFSPINYVDRIRANKLYFRIGTHDLLIPSYQGELLGEALKSRADEADMQTYSGADHAATIYLASRDLRRKNKV